MLHFIPIIVNFNNFFLFTYFYFLFFNIFGGGGGISPFTLYFLMGFVMGGKYFERDDGIY